MKKPVCSIGGCYENIYKTIESVSDCVKRNIGSHQARVFKEKAANCASYDKVLRVASEYVELHFDEQEPSNA